MISRVEYLNGRLSGGNTALSSPWIPCARSIPSSLLCSRYFLGLYLLTVAFFHDLTTKHFFLIACMYECFRTTNDQCEINGKLKCLVIYAVGNKTIGQRSNRGCQILIGPTVLTVLRQVGRFGKSVDIEDLNAGLGTEDGLVATFSREVSLWGLIEVLYLRVPERARKRRTSERPCNAWVSSIIIPFTVNFLVGCTVAPLFDSYSYCFTLTFSLQLQFYWLRVLEVIIPLSTFWY